MNIFDGGMRGKRVPLTWVWQEPSLSMKSIFVVKNIAQGLPLPWRVPGERVMA
jgi:hypothetical protein